MKVLLLSDGTFVASHTARRLVDLGHAVLDIRADDVSGRHTDAADAAADMAEQIEQSGCNRVLCLLGAHAISGTADTALISSMVTRATQVARLQGARFVLASSAPRAASPRLALLAFEQQVARAAWQYGLDAGVCRLEGVYGGYAMADEQHPLMGPLVSSALTATHLHLNAPLDALHWPLHVRDAVDGIVRMLDRGAPERVRLAGAIPYRTRDLVATVEAVLGVPMRLTADRLDERRSTHPPHIADARRSLRWRPRVGLFAGVEEQAFTEATRESA